jgi:probable O-glycosylation ligase (exosortase A-associated)
MRSLFLTAIFLSFLVLGVRAPFIFALGYIWIDLMSPQVLSYSIITRLSVSQWMGIAALLAIFAVPKDKNPRAPAQTWILVLLAAWMTLSLLWAVAPASSAIEKWDTAFKSLTFCAILPLLIRTRVQLEAALWVLLLSGASHCIAVGIKTIITGGGYGQMTGLIQSNYGFGEGSTLSMFAVMLIPLCAYLGKHNTLMPQPRLVPLAMLAVSALCILAVVGTHARTGIISMLVLAVLWCVSSTRVIRNLALVAAGVGLVFLFAPDSWFERMSSTTDDTEKSSMSRVAVWLWVLKFVGENPLGGSFNMYVISDASIGLADGTTLDAARLAYHSIYFEILGEGGLPGAILYAILLLSTFGGLRAVRRRATTAGGADAAADVALAVALRNSILVFMAGGAFIGVGFQSLLYLIVMLAAVFINISRAPTAR